jgi:hypothetical protein
MRNPKKRKTMKEIVQRNMLVLNSFNKLSTKSKSFKKENSEMKAKMIPTFLKDFNPISASRINKSSSMTSLDSI